ncbi:MAG: alpha amylase C-terminal domain-containing protein, partial [Lachnospiraceae bacterium]|nr:alpha amylase C-terminal domain-containing protein [Lachnospiraceae bacterium]
LLYGYMMTHPGKKLLFMGQEFAQFREFSEIGELDWNLLDFDAHTILRDYVKALNHLYKKEPALYELDNNVEGFEWINANAANESIVSFLRKTSKKEETLLIVCNFTPAVYDKYRIGVPYAGSYKEIFCSDNTMFGGNGTKNRLVCTSKRSACDERKNSITIGLAPLSMSIFKLVKEDTAKRKNAGKTAVAKKESEKKKTAAVERKKAAASKELKNPQKGSKE